MTSSTWQETTLGEQLTFQRGYDITKKEQEAGPYPVVSSSGVKSYHKAFKVDGPGVVIGRKGTLGTAFYVDDGFWPHDTTLWVKDFHGNNPKFAYFFIQCMGFEQYDCGASNPTLNRNHIHKLPIAFPPLPTQRKIASILSAYDDLIENNTRRIAILEEMAQAIYWEWFVNFRFPGHENVKLIDAPLGKIPEEWSTVTVGSVAEIHRGRSYKSENLVSEGGKPFLNLKCIERDGGFRRDGIKRYNGPIKPNQIARSGDIVMGVTDMTQERRLVARAALVPRLSEEESVFSMDLVKIEPTKADRLFMYGLLRFSEFADNVKQHANGANVLHLNPKAIADFVFTLPTTIVQSTFSASLEPMTEHIDVLHLKNDNLRQTRDLLLPKLISGQLDVEELDIDPGQPLVEN